MEIVTVTIDGKERRFLKDRLEAYFLNNPGAKIKFPKIEKTKKKQVSRYIRVTERKKRNNTPRKGKQVIVNNRPYIYLSEAARDLKINKGHLHRRLEGKTETTIKLKIA